jgi:branched-subunit amino acid ABC-type transport system permease component
VRDFLPFVIAGVASGVLYGLAATGLVLTYKTSGIFNFAHGAIAAACAYVFHDLRDGGGLPWAAALALTLLVFAPALAMLLELVARQISAVPVATTILATVGLLVAIQGVIARRYGLAPPPFPSFLPAGTFTVAGVRVGYDQLTIVAVSVTCVAALFVFFRVTAVGLQMRAVVDNADLLDLTGRSPAFVRRLAWAIGCSFAGLSGILVATIVGLDLTFLTLLVVASFGAAAVGRFRNLGVTFAAAIAIGVAGEIVKKYVPENPALAGIPPSLPFLVLFGVLLLSPPGRFKEREARRAPRRPSRLPAWARRSAGLLGVIGVLAVPAMAGGRLPVYTNAAILVIVFVSLGLLVELSGQASLCQMSFAAVGATSFAHFTQGAGLPWLPACVLAGLVVIPLGALLSVPAIRLSRLYLALATFGFAILVQQFGFFTGLMFGSGGTRLAARPAVLGLDGDRGFFYLCAGLALASLLLAVVIARSRLGRLLSGMADSPVAMAAHGADIHITRVLVFCLSAFMSGIAGVLLICLTGTAAANGTTFGFLQSLLLLVVLTISGRSLVVAPVVAAFLLAVLPSFSTDPAFGSTQQIAFGALAVLTATIRPSAVAGMFKRAATASAWRRAWSPVSDRSAAPVPLEVTS